METHYTFCRICESLCGLKITTEDNLITDIKPDKLNVATRGFSCIKGRKQHELYQSPDRLKFPLKRMENGEYKRISWDIALKEIGSKVNDLIEENDPDSVAMYVGTAAGFSVLHPVMAQGFMTALGSKSMYASATQDCSNKFAVAREIYGFPFTQPFPDLDNINCLIIVGANPVISKWSFLQVVNPAERLKKMEEKGVVIYNIDPRRTETAEIAGKHIFIRPGTDVFFYLSFLNELINQGGVNISRCRKHMVGYDQIVELSKKWTPDYTTEVTGIEPDMIVEMVRNYIRGDGSAIYCSTGVNMGINGTLAFWIQEVINAISGNLDRRGGSIVGKGVIDFIKFGVKYGILMRNDISRIGKLKSVNDAFPGGILAEEILTPGKKQVKALFVTGGNPLITMPNSEKLKKSFQKLDLLVSIDIYLNETASEAHYVLPATDPFQRPDLPFIFPLMLGLQHKPYLQATASVVDPVGEQRDEASIYFDLAKACYKPIFGSRIADKFFSFMKSYHSRKNPNKLPGLPQKALLNGLLRLTRQKSFSYLLKNPHGIIRGAHKPESFLSKRVTTIDKKVNLAPDSLINHAKKLDIDYKFEKQNANKFKLITRRAVVTQNSWTHNSESMIKIAGNTNYAYLNEHDMNELGLKDDDIVDISNSVSKIRLPVKKLDTLMTKCVAVPHGWGHQHAKGLNIANKTTGVNVNLIAADGPDNIDAVSGMATLTGIYVDIVPSKEKVKPSWSGC